MEACVPGWAGRTGTVEPGRDRQRATAKGRGYQMSTNDDAGDSGVENGGMGDIGMLRCQSAVIRAYDNLRNAGVRDQQAFLAAARLYRTHHPEADMDSARLRVANWIYDRTPDA